VTEKVGLVRGFGHVIHLGNGLATAEGRLMGPYGELYGHAGSSCFIFDAP
jgi:hypothetical protein